MKNESKKAVNPFIMDPNHFGEMTVGQLVEIIVQNPSEFPKGMDTRVCVGDVEGNLGVISDVQVTDHKGVRLRQRRNNVSERRKRDGKTTAAGERQ